MDIMQYGFRKCVLSNFELSQWLAKNMLLLPNNDNSSMSDTSCLQASICQPQGSESQGWVD